MVASSTLWGYRPVLHNLSEGVSYLPTLHTLGWGKLIPSSMFVELMIVPNLGGHLDTLTEDHQHMSVEKSKVGTTINDWAHAVRKGNRNLADQLDEDRLIGFRAIEGLGLPRFRQETMIFSEFLRNPQEYLDRIGSQKFYVNLPPRKEGLKRYRQIDLSRDEVLPFIQEHVSASQSCDYTMVLFEFYENQYSGNIVIDDNGGLVVEMVKGSHAPLVSGEKTPEFFIRRDKFTGSLSYSFEDETLRKAVWNMLLAIPHYSDEFSTGDTDRYARFTPGYYEFVLIRRGDARPLEAVFLDYRGNRAYQLSPNSASFPMNTHRQGD